MAVFVASCSDSDTYAVKDPWSVQETLEWEYKVSAGDCHTPDSIDHSLLQQSWHSDTDARWLAFGNNSLSDYAKNIETTYCIDGNTIVARTYTTQPRFSIGSVVVQHAARHVAKKPNLRWQVLELTRQRLVLKDLAEGSQTVWLRKD